MELSNEEMILLRDALTELDNRCSYIIQKSKKAMPVEKRAAIKKQLMILLLLDKIQQEMTKRYDD